MSAQSSRGIRRYAYLAAAITIAALVVSAGLVVAPTLETTKTSTSISVVTTTLSQTTPTTTRTFTSTIYSSFTSTIYSSFTSTIYSTITEPKSSPPVSPCNTFVWNASNPGAPSGVPVLLIHPNSTGYVCVTYQTAFDFNSFSLSNPVHFSPFQVRGLCTRENGATSCEGTASPSFQNGVTPSYLALSGNLTFFTVVYAVDALSNSTGFYNDGAVGTGCQDEPMAVGYSASQVNASDFSLPPYPPECPAAPFWPFSEYITGMNATFINGLQP